jgi:hypothetical protein
VFGRNKKTTIFAVRKIKTILKRKILKNEKDISAIEQKEKKQTWFQGKNGNCQRQKSIESPPCKRPEKTYSF